VTDVAPLPAGLTEPPPATRGAAAWRAGLLIGAVVGVGLMWLLARVIWLPAYFGVFFFLIAGMLVGAAAFRTCRAARPVTRGRIAVGVGFITASCTAAGLSWEYRYRSMTIGEPPKFGEARLDARASASGGSDVGAQATAAFRAFLRREYPPGGAIGYVRWAAGSGFVRLTLPSGFADETVLGQRRWAWVLRTLAAYGLFAAGVWYQLEALRSAEPVSNILRPGEEAVDE
jgi:hypothetical protein